MRQFLYLNLSNIGLIGCFDSHIAVIKMVYERGCKNALIFEDDFTNTKAYNEKIIKEVTDFMKLNNTWLSIKLGYVPIQKETHLMMNLIQYFISNNVSKHIIKWSGLASHAYIVSRKCMEILIPEGIRELKKPLDKIRHYDIFYQEVLDQTTNECYSVIPLMFDQKWCFQSNNSLPPYAKFGERLFRYKNNQCLLERTGIMYYVSLLRYNRKMLFILFMIVFNILFAIMVVYYTFMV